MPRPVCCRRVGAAPAHRCFAPTDDASSPFGAVVLLVDELEAIRLADLERLYHEQAADEMNVSRQTFGRILDTAHAKLADAIVNGRSLRVQGGNVEMTDERTFRCTDCGHTWTVQFCTGRPAGCTACGSANFRRADSAGCCGTGKGRGHRHGHHHGAGQCCKTTVAVTAPSPTE
jgi:uncharacterized protein